MKKIDFRKISVQDVTGKNSALDISKELGNAIYKNTTDLGELDFAQELYKKGEVDVDDKTAAIIRQYMDVSQFFAFVKAGVNKELDSINAKK